MLFVFVEGSDDERFFKHYYRSSNVKIIQYARMSNKEFTNYVNTIKINNDYIVITDSDGATEDEKKKIFVEKHPCCEYSKVYVARWEIESWYLAGWSSKEAEKYKVKYIYNTNQVSKEKFRSLTPKNFDSVSFQMEILKTFDCSLAISRNTSFSTFAT